MIGAPAYEPILRALGSVLAFLYDLVPSYGVSIIMLTLGIRVLLLPLGIKQIRSMHAMQALQPKLKVLQQKYKGNRQKLAEEQMKLYKEHGSSPFGSCLPLLLQIPVLLALFAVLRFPGGLDRIPENSDLRAAIESQQTGFLGANLLCAPSQAGSGLVELPPGERARTDRPLDCGTGVPVRIPHYLLLAAMIGTTFYQTWQMQRASPTSNPQQQLMGRIMPVFFGFIGFTFPAGLIVYWTTTNLVQIAQQHFMLPKKGETTTVAAGGGGDGARRQQDGARRQQKGAEDTGGSTAGGRRRSQGTGEESAKSAERRRAGGRRARGSGSGGTEASPKAGNSGGRQHGGSRKKRRKR